MSKKLEVGDVLYRPTAWHGLQKHVIDRVTPKRAMAGLVQYISEPESEGRYKVVGEYGASRIETPELIEKYRVQEFYQTAYIALKNFDVSKYSEDKLTRILNIINEKP